MGENGRYNLRSAPDIEPNYPDCAGSGRLKGCIMCLYSVVFFNKAGEIFRKKIFDIDMIF